jgi:hypothetical protein
MRLSHALDQSGLLLRRPLLIPSLKSRPTRRGARCDRLHAWPLEDAVAISNL